MNKNKSIVLVLISIILLIIVFFVLNWYTHKINPIPDQIVSDGTLSEFIFTQDYKVEQPNYNGGDWPNGTKVTKFKKGDIVEGKYGIDGCEGLNCVPPKIVIFIVNGQNIAVDTSILIPYINPSNDNAKDLNVGGALNSQISTNMANPAPVNCESKGGKTVIQNDINGGQYGLCYFDDNRACEEWAMFNGDCPVGGIKTTGYDTIDQKYCVWLGGQTSAVSNSICTFKDGKKCSTLDFYNGTCSK